MIISSDPLFLFGVVFYNALNMAALAGTFHSVSGFSEPFGGVSSQCQLAVEKIHFFDPFFFFACIPQVPYHLVFHDA